MMEKKIPHEFNHIKTLKDVKMLKNIELNPEKNSDFPLICPISKIEYNGLNKFKAFWSCGCICSEKAIDELSKGKTEKLCIVCSTPYGPRDEISLNLNIEEQFAKKHQLLVQIEKDNIQVLFFYKAFFWHFFLNIKKAEHKIQKDKKKEKKKEKGKKGEEDDEEEKTHKKIKLNSGEAKKINQNGGTEPFKNILDTISEKNEGGDKSDSNKLHFVFILSLIKNSFQIFVP